MRQNSARRSWLKQVSGWSLAWCAKAATAGTAPAGLKPLGQWDFAQPQAGRAWRFTAKPAAATKAGVLQAQLALDAQLYEPTPGHPACPLAAAELPLTDARWRQGRFQRLLIELDVSRWALGLGRFDDDVPRLELVYRGQRHQLGLSGFKKMPGTVQVSWTAADGLQARYDGVASGRRSRSTADAGAPSLRLWIDGCSEAGAQSLRIDRLTLWGA
ncbi:hypothetical protein KGA65_06575 [Ideonella sp. B7]|uniref:hypothetical protein n=1 Tax=Ideonella benzenivorans TaxID=2831643 RepID=UPI001CED848F|nr:hypothetical protein [Ideonella benzenivorans]MCA6216200.1 hypothetical protein [Ideonella benzenivorans]